MAPPLTRAPHNTIVVVGQMRDKEQRERVGVLDVSGPIVRVVRDEFHADPAALAAELNAPLGGWDVMYATRWKYAWCDGRIWDRRGLRAKVLQPGLVDVRRPRLALLRAEYARLSVIGVRGRLRDGWLTRSVNVVDGHFKEHVVARHRELSVVIDPVYDGIDLMFDSFWCVAMARTLAKALDVPCELDEDLR